MCLYNFLAQAPEEHHGTEDLSQSPERRARSVSPLTAHRESQEIKDDDVSRVRQGHDPSPKSSPVNDTVQYDNDAVQRSGSFRGEEQHHLETSHVSSTGDHSSGNTEKPNWCL